MSRPTVERSNSNLSRVARVPRSEVARGRVRVRDALPKDMTFSGRKMVGFDGLRNDSNVR